MTSPTHTEALLLSAHAGDVDSLARLLEVYRPDIRRYAQQRCFISDVDDAVQEALLVLARHLRSVRKLTSFSSWLFKVVQRECRRLGRSVLRQDPYEEAAVDAWMATHTPESLKLDMASALESLPPHYLQVLLLRDFEELSIREIGERLGLDSPAVKSRLHRARVMVREYLLA
ncbi:sigma-70 family RNA polymerase sigma factor [Pyxidicoccus parkwayensis]|jgi:RNA polymerase sigma factor (sigma-70 family)|uniref:Sigma-70 family RNA polymerase sigma factor n=1 Tax=Pyxidicoccus parkwayensis TaxID=2813578 RepID=A0ABX7P6C0_9BACT|nr:sigma-70 family RNA polymerase sigma factor [Pyxidicoccus parkwaysis]QSQ25947.1 sigma-70 family RNA polymerase sigma factor [Pyxidicoccus parkwaysis]